MDAITAIYKVAEPRPSEVVLAEAVELLKITGLGYPTVDSEARKALSELVEKGRGTDDVFMKAMNDFYAETNVEQPADGKYYRVAAVNSEGDEGFVTYENGAVGLTADADDLMIGVFRVAANEDGTLTLSTYDSKYECYVKSDRLIVENVSAEETFGLFSLYGTLGGNGNAYSRVNFENGVWDFMNSYVLDNRVGLVLDEDMTTAFRFTEVAEEDLVVPEATFALTPADGNDVEQLDVVKLKFTTPFAVALKDANLISLKNEYGAQSAKVKAASNDYELSFINVLAGTYTLEIAEGAFAYSFFDKEIPLKAISATYNVKEGADFTYDFNVGDMACRVDGEEGREYFMDTALNTLTVGFKSKVTVNPEKTVFVVDEMGVIITTGHLEKVEEAENVYKFVPDTPITEGSLEAGTYTFVFEEGMFGDANYAKYLADPMSVLMSDCHVSVELKSLSVKVNNENIPESTTYSLIIKAIGNGTVIFDDSTVRSTTSSFTVNEGGFATITFILDDGYRIKSVKVDGSDVTSSLSNNQYTINNISKNTTIEVEFETIPPTTYTLTVKAIGNGTVICGDSTIKFTTNSFTVNEGGFATITFIPDDGYRIKSVKVNGSDVTSSVSSDNQYTVSNINKDTMVEVEFEAIPPTTYTLTITSTDNGSAAYDETEIRGTSNTFTIDEGNDATITFAPDSGYRIKSVKVNGSDVTSRVLDNQYTVSNIRKNTTVEVEFEAIPPTTYSLTIKATGNGSASFNETTVSNNNTTFTVDEGKDAVITFTPDNGYRIMSVKVNGVLVASDVSTYQYTVSYISSDTTVEVEFMEQLMAFSSNGVNYSVASYDDRTVTVGSGNYGKALEVPAYVSHQEKTWKVTGIDNGAMADNARLAAVIWNAETRFTPNVSNPNFLLYVKSADYAPSTVKNVVVNGSAKSITLTDATNGNDFYCPQEFTAQRISYTHNYMMTTGIGESRGWETIALPFDVQQVTHQSGGELVPFAKWQSGNEGKPFWLMELGSSGWTEATAIKANTPYIISMPNNENYKPEFRVNGNVTFKAENVTVRRSDETESRNGNGKTFVPNFTNQESAGYYALNVSNDYVTYSGGAAEGSRFVAGLRPVRPFEAYMTSEAGVREIAIADDLATGIAQAIVLIGGRGDTKVYDLKGRVVADGAGCSQEELRRMLPYGVYIFNGRKLIVK